MPQYKSTYGIGSFGVAIGYDATGSAASYPMADAFYLEMYDFYVNNAPTLTLVQVNANDNPPTFVDKLVKNVLGPYVSKYGDARFHFMWSVQAKSSANCIYPLSGRSCGSSDDFGLFSAPEFNQFLQQVQQKYPVLAGRDHGIFQFNFLPPSWF